MIDIDVKMDEHIAKPHPTFQAFREVM